MGLFNGPPADEKRSFAALVSRAVEARGHACQPAGDVVRIDGPQPGVLSLTNVWQLCLQSPPRQWKAVIDRFLDTVLPGLEAAPEEDLESVKPALRVRLVPEGDDVSPLVSRPAAEGLRAVLALDRPTMVELVPTARLRRWGADEDDLFERAYENVLAAPAPSVSAAPVQDGVLITRISSDSFYTTTWVRWLSELLGPLPPAGVLVGLPARHEILVHPIAGMTAVHAVQPLSTVIAHSYRKGPGSLSPHLYWWRAGTLSRLPFAARAGTFRFIPPDEFLDAVNGAA